MYLISQTNRTTKKLNKLTYPVDGVIVITYHNTIIVEIKKKDIGAHRNLQTVQSAFMLSFISLKSIIVDCVKMYSVVNFARYL